MAIYCLIILVLIGVTILQAQHCTDTEVFLRDGKPINCNQKILRETCPEGSTCEEPLLVIDGVCCYDSRRVPDNSCEGTDVYKDFGIEQFCGPEITDKCPQIAYCDIKPNKGYGVCCLKKVPDNSCEGGYLYVFNGNQIFCDNENQDCGHNNYCDIKPNNPVAACCNKRIPDGACAKTGVFRLYRDEVYCGGPEPITGCPGGSYCETKPNNVFSVCCKNRMQESYCNGQKLYLDSNENTVLCGSLTGKNCPPETECKYSGFSSTCCYIN